MDHQQQLDQSFQIVAGKDKRQETLLNANNPFAVSAKNQMMQNTSKMDEISKQTQEALYKIQTDLGSYLI